MLKNHDPNILRLPPRLKTFNGSSLDFDGLTR